jgi:hypothetical protein
MYNDNLRQLDNLYHSLTTLQESNDNIRNLISQLLHISPTANLATNLGQTVNLGLNPGSPANLESNLGRPTERNTYISEYLRRTANITQNPRISRNIPERTANLTSNRRRDNTTDRHYVELSLPPSILSYLLGIGIDDSLRDPSYTNELLQYLLEPVNIYPTQAQIDNAVRTVHYRDIVSPLNTQCPIGLEDFDDNDIVMVIRQCGHIFNRNNLMNWFRSNCKCPVCRYDIRNYNPRTSRELNNDASNNLLL